MLASLITRENKALIIHRTSLPLLHRRQVQTSPLDFVRKVAAFQFEVARLSSLVDASGYEPFLLRQPTPEPSSPIKLAQQPSCLFDFENDDHPVVQKMMSLKMILLGWLPLVLLNILLLGMKNHCGLSLAHHNDELPITTFSAGQELLGYDKTKFALEPSLNWAEFDSDMEYLQPPQLASRARNISRSPLIILLGKSLSVLDLLFKPRLC